MNRMPMNHMPLNRLAPLVAMTGAILASAPACAGDWKGQSLATKRQIVSEVIACMRTRMSHDRLISYNQAARACKSEVQARLEKVTAGPLVAATTPPK
ncbi:MAG TPA: hypothetical protein VME42_07075 [Steroidobacteraceae bacterium]|nr:hypothetical protein [Steroidobacteraceae bacterium]